MKNIIASIIIVSGILLVTLPQVYAHGGDDDDSSSSSSSSSVSSGSNSSASSNSSESEDSSHSQSSSSSSNSSRSSDDNERSVQRNSALEVPSGVTSNVSGKARFQSKGNRRLRISVRVPVGSSTPTLPSVDQAEELDLTAQISRTASVLASCQLEFKQLKQNNSQALYEVDVRSKKRKQVREKYGTCVLLDSSQIGVPTIKKGDSISVSNVAAGTVLEGSF